MPNDFNNAFHGNHLIQQFVKCFFSDFFFFFEQKLSKTKYVHGSNKTTQFVVKSRIQSYTNRQQIGETKPNQTRKLSKMCLAEM